MANLFELAAKLTLDSSDYEKGIEAAKQAAANFSKGLTAIVTATQNADKVVTAAADSAEQFSVQTSNAANSADEFQQAEEQVSRAADESAKSIENAVDAVSELQDSSESVTRTIDESSNSMNDAADEAKKLGQAAETAESGITNAQEAVVSASRGFNIYEKAIETVRNKFAPFGEALRNVIDRFSRATVAANENSDAMEADGREAQTLKNRIAMLQGVLDSAKKEVERLTDEFNKSAEETGATSDETKELARQLDKAEREYKEAERELKQYSEQTDDTTDNVKKLGDEEEKTTKKTSTFGDTLKAILTSDAIKAGLSAVVNCVKTIGRAFINVGKQAVDAYGNYEQLADGVKKLYGDASKAVMDNAKQAYKTSGMSANQYMEQATMFSASLVNSLKGDTKKAADLTDVAMRAISDNFNTFGSDIQSVQNAFQGFSKQNYTMLDNLKLGYGGTKSEMERLIKDANQYAKTIGEASDLSIDSFADIVKAIDLVQRKQGIAGTTTEEAQKTIQGSLAMTKAAWENLLVAIADEDADFDGAIDNLIESATAAGQNLIPRVEHVIKGIGRAIEKLLPIALEEAPKAIARYAPEIWNAVKNLLSIIYTSTNDTLINTDWTAIGAKIANGINNIDWVSLFGNAATTIGNAVTGLLDLLIEFIETIDWFKLGLEIFYSIVTVVENIDWQEVVATAFRLLGAAIGGASKLIGGLSVAIKSILNQAMAEVKAYFAEKTKEAGGNVVKGIFVGIIDAMNGVNSWIEKNIVLPIINGFKAGFGIHSPSTVMMTMGKYIVDGLLNGVKNAPSRVLAIFSEIKSRIVSWGSGILTTAKQIGGNLMTGLIGGINNKVGLVYKKISDVGNSVVSKVKNVFGVHSPSTVMKQIGDYLMQGLSIGVDSNAYKPIRSVSTVGNEMTKALDFDGSIGQFGGIIDAPAYAPAYAPQETNTERLLVLILETLRGMDTAMYSKIQSALDGTNIKWNDRELGRLVKSYA